jgi:LytR cell envelope-related transcriptional attenuator
VAAAVGLVANVLGGRTVAAGGKAPAPDPSAAVAVQPVRHYPYSTALIGTRGGVGPRRSALVWVALLSHDGGDSGSIIYVPAHTAAEVPGRGLRNLADAYSSGGLALLLVSIENLLDVDIDRYLEMSDSEAEALFASVGALSIDVPSDVRIGAGARQARLLFSAGLQEVPENYLAHLLYVVGLDSGETELGTRHLAFWDALMERFGSDPVGLEEAVLNASAALSDSNSTPEDNADLLATIAGVEDSNMTLSIVPVRDVGAGGAPMYELDASAAQHLLEGLTRSPATGEEDNRVQVLNGNGVPGIGQAVGQTLVDGGFRVTLSGNAPSLDYRITRIVTYDSSPEGLEEAARVRDLLGLGEIQVSPQTQGIVDLTVVVGRDFVRAH